MPRRCPLLQNLNMFQHFEPAQKCTKAAATLSPHGLRDVFTPVHRSPPLMRYLPFFADFLPDFADFMLTLCC